MKEYIDILGKDGNTKKAEVVFRYHSAMGNLFYIVYLYNNEYFAAKYDDVVGTSKLDTNLSEEELELLERVLNGITVNNL